MAMDLKPEPPYHPFRGMNPDANGITARTDECVDAVNIIIKPSYVQTRSGSELLGDFDWAAIVTVTDAEDAILNQDYAFDNGSATDATWEYNDFECSIEHDFDNNVWVLSGAAEVYTAPVTSPFIPPTTGWSQPDGEPSALQLTQPIAGQLPSAVLEYHSYIDPLDGNKVFAFLADAIYRYDEGAISGQGTWVECSNGTLDSGVTMEQWDITDFVDKDVGATIVAAACQLTRPTEAYVEGESRRLVYYDPAVGEKVFKKLDVYSAELAEEYFNMGNLSDPAIFTTGVTGYADLTNLPVVAGSAYFIVEGAGVVAITGTRIVDPHDTGEDHNFLLSIGTTDPQMLEGSNSWINLDTGEYSIEFEAGIANNLQLSILYAYEELADYRPICVANYHGALVIANTYEDLTLSTEYFPWRTRWSQPQNMKLFLPADYQELALTDISPILKMRALETAASSNLFGPLYFYKHNSVVRGIYNQNYLVYPETPVPMFEFELAFSEGIEAVNTIVNFEGKHMFLGRNDVYMFNGYERVSLTHDQETGSTKIQECLFDHLSLDSLSKCFGIYDETNRRYILYWVRNGNSGYPTDAVVYDLDRNFWTRWTTPETSAGISMDIAATGVIAKLPGTIVNLPGVIDDLNSSLGKVVLLAMTDATYYVTSPGGNDRGKTFEDPIDSYFITRDFLGGTLEEQDRTEKVMVEAIGDSVEMSWNGDYEWGVDDFHDAHELKFTTKYRRETYHPDTVTTSIRFMVRLLGITKFRWLQVFNKQQEFTNE